MKSVENRCCKAFGLWHNQIWFPFPRLNPVALYFYLHYALAFLYIIFICISIPSTFQNVCFSKDYILFDQWFLYLPSSMSYT